MIALPNSAGWLALGAGSALTFARSLPGRVFGVARRRLSIEVEIRGNTSLYDYVLNWMSAHPSLARNRNWGARTIAGDLAAKQNCAGQSASCGSSASSSVTDSVDLYPGFGVFVLRHHGRPIWITRSQEDQKGMESTPREKLHILLPFGSSSDLRNLLTEITLEQQSHRADYLPAWRVAGHGWDTLRGLARRPFPSVVLPAGVAEDLRDDLRAFRTHKQFYRSMGIPWRRQVLLEGPPGSGKTSFVQALASELSLELYCMNLGSVFNDDAFFNLLAHIGPGSMLLIEDVDGARATATRRPPPANIPTQAGFWDGQSSPEQPTPARIEGVSLSALLNGLDGVFSQDGVITILTTNHPERLDPAFLRPGRVDRRIHIGAPNTEQINRLWQRFFPTDPWRGECSDASSMAVAQHHFAQAAKASLGNGATA